MAQEEHTKAKQGQGARAAMHTPSAVRLMRTMPPASSEPLNPRDFLKMDARIRRRVLVSAALVLAVLVVVVSAGVSAGIVEGPRLNTSTPVETPALTTHGFLEMTVEAEGWDAGSSTPVIVRLRPEGSDDYSVCHALSANMREALELDEGRYYVSWITPVDADGSLYIPPDESLVTISAGHTESKNVAFQRVPLHEASFGDYAATFDVVREAIAHGDETLQGEAGDLLLSRLADNMAAAPNYGYYY